MGYAIFFSFGFLLCLLAGDDILKLRCAKVTARLLQRDATRMLISHLSADQKEPLLPSNVRANIKAFVGDNDGCTGEELKQLAREAKKRYWNKFYHEKLRPQAERGKGRVKISDDIGNPEESLMERFFPGLDVDEVKDIAAQHGVTFTHNWPGPEIFSWDG